MKKGITLAYGFIFLILLSTALGQTNNPAIVKWYGFKAGNRIEWEVVEFSLNQTRINNTVCGEYNVSCETNWSGQKGSIISMDFNEDYTYTIDYSALYNGHTIPDTQYTIQVDAKNLIDAPDYDPVLPFGYVAEIYTFHDGYADFIIPLFALVLIYPFVELKGETTNLAQFEKRYDGYSNGEIFSFNTSMPYTTSTNQYFITNGIAKDIIYQSYSAKIHIQYKTRNFDQSSDKQFKLYFDYAFSTIGIFVLITSKRKFISPKH